MTAPVLRHVAGSPTTSGQVPLPHRAEHGATQGPTGPDVHERVRALLQGVAQGHRNLANQIDELAELLPQIRLAARAEQSVHASVPETKAQPAKLLGVRQVAERLGVDPKTVRRWREDGKLPPAIVIGGILRWRPEVIDPWLKEREAKG